MLTSCGRAGSRFVVVYIQSKTTASSGEITSHRDPLMKATLLRVYKLIFYYKDKIIRIVNCVAIVGSS